VDYQNLIEKRLKIIKLLIIIRYIYELQKAFKKPPSQELPSLRGRLLGLKLSKPSAFADTCFKKSFWLPEGTALGFSFRQYGTALTLFAQAGEDEVRTHTYDYKNKIITASNGSKTISFEYDPFGRRISKSNGSTAINYYYAGDQVIEEQNSSGSTLKQYIYGNLIDEVLRMDKYNNNTIENSFYYHTDSIGNITAITDKDGNIIERYKYNIYGSPTITDNTGNVLSESAIGNDYLFQSRRYDKELHLYYYRARTYDPQIGRFLQTDPLGYKDSMNLYQAMNMNGFNFVDPWGEDWFLENEKWVWRKKKGGKRYLITVKSAGKNEEGGTIQLVTLYNQKEVMLKEKCFSGGVKENRYVYPPLPRGNYYINLWLRDEYGPTVNEYGELNSYYGIQKIPETVYDEVGNPYDARDEWGTMRARLIPVEGEANVPKERRGNYLHGKFLNKKVTHGCLCNKNEKLLYRLWDLSVKNQGKKFKIYVAVDMEVIITNDKKKK